MRRRTTWILVSSLAVLAAIAAVAAAVPPNLARAIEAQQRLAAERPQDAAVFNDLGNLLLLVPQLDQAEAAYRRALELDPNKSSALYNLGLLLQQKGERKEAVELYQRLVKTEPSHAWGHYQLGTLYENAGQESKAIEAYAQAFALDPQLAFPEVNPHIVDNKLLTEAMLRAYKSEIAPPQAPKAYEDPSRIAALLVPPPGAAKPKDELGTQRQEGAPAKAPQQPGAAGQAPGPTVIRERDLDRANPSGQAVTGGVPRGVGVPGMQPAQPRTLREWNRPDPNIQEIPNEGVVNEEVEQPGQVITPPPGGVYYRPGVQSTGRLGLQIVPEKRPARRG